MSWTCFGLLTAFLLGASAVQAAERPTIINENTREVFHDLQVAIDAASAGDVLKIKGTCVGNFFVVKSLTLVGNNHAVLDGNNLGTVLTTFTPFGETDMATVIIDNLKIQNGLALTLGGGGILNIGANVIIGNSEIVNNLAPFDAGGGVANMTLSLLPSFMVIDQSEISNNTAGAGGGIANTAGFLEITDSKITSNIAEEAGGGIFSFFGNNAIFDTKIAYNAAILQGGGIENIADSQTVLNNVELIDNRAGQGGGIFSGSQYFGGSSIAINNSELRGNNTQTLGGGLFNDSGSRAALNSSRVVKNGAAEGGGIVNNIGGTTFLNDTEVKKNIPNNIVGEVIFL